MFMVFVMGLQLLLHMLEELLQGREHLELLPSPVWRNGWSIPQAFHNSKWVHHKQAQIH